MKSNTNTQSKSDFIRNQPATMSAAEIVEKAKGQGIDLSAGLVYEVRRTARARRSPISKKATAAVAKKPSSRATSMVSNGGTQKTGLSKAAFVRQFPNLPPKEIVEKAKAERINLDVGYVYNIRSSSKATRMIARRTGTEDAGARGATIPKTITSSAESLLRTVAAEIGLGRALEILAGERARFRAVLAR